MKMINKSTLSRASLNWHKEIKILRLDVFLLLFANHFVMNQKNNRLKEKKTALKCHMVCAVARSMCISFVCLHEIERRIPAMLLPPPPPPSPSSSCDDSGRDLIQMCFVFQVRVRCTPHSKWTEILICGLHE